MEHPVLIQHLWNRGWLQAFRSLEAALTCSDQVLESAIRAYQAFHGLPGSGAATPDTCRSLLDSRCGHPDKMAVTETHKWNDPHITWTVSGGLPHIPADEFKKVLEWSWGQWATVCGIKPEFITDTSVANVVTSVGTIDGPGNTLAWTELPDGSGHQRRQVFDQAEQWCVAQTPPRYQKDLARVAIHEIGHALGLFHLDVGNLMAPTYDPKIRLPQKGDIEAAVLRYGTP